VGLLQRADVIHAYDIALTRRAALRHQAHQVHLGAVTPEMVNVVEVLVQAGCKCAGSQVKDIPWPRECVIASLRRGRQVLIPHGNTVLKPGDVLVAVAGEKEQEEIRSLCSSQD
jgi:Trk K+ transport system NAD-binding subunit